VLGSQFFLYYLCSCKIFRMNSRIASRRNFLKAAGMAGAAVAITEGPWWRLIAADRSPSPSLGVVVWGVGLGPFVD
jgi:TAT (twin-arginine translocation) pathway signal sequence